jgi:hypothetical protein
MNTAPNWVVATDIDGNNTNTWFMYALMNSQRKTKRSSQSSQSSPSSQPQIVPSGIFSGMQLDDTPNNKLLVEQFLRTYKLVVISATVREQDWGTVFKRSDTDRMRIKMERKDISDARSRDASPGSKESTTTIDLSDSPTFFDEEKL